MKEWKEDERMIVSEMSRKEAHEFTKTNPRMKTAIISITGMDGERNEFIPQPSILDILWLKFDDVGPDDPHCIKPEDTRQIAEFVYRHANDVEQILVHCEAGVSRSAGVGAAIAYVSNGNNDD